MAENTKIEWTNHTFNPWIGCDKVSPACDHCYAESLNKRTGGGNWGIDAPRRRTSAHYWNDPIRWSRKAAAAGTRPWVFCASMADVFDKRADPNWRAELFDLIKATPLLRWQLLTKRIGNVFDMLPDGFPHDFPHVGIMSTIANQQEADRDIPKLIRLKADRGVTWVGLSCEPLLGPVDLTPWLGRLDWVIGGGESGHHARPSHPDWFRGLRDQCAEADVPYLFKQWGDWASVYDRDHDDPDWRRCDIVKHETPAGRWMNLVGGHGFHGDRVVRMNRMGKKDAGRLLDGRTHDGFPRAYDADKVPA